MVKKDKVEKVTDGDGKETMQPKHQGVDYAKLTPILTKGLRSSCSYRGIRNKSSCTRGWIMPLSRITQKQVLARVTLNGTDGTSANAGDFIVQDTSADENDNLVLEENTDCCRYINTTD